MSTGATVTAGGRFGAIVGGTTTIGTAPALVVLPPGLASAGKGSLLGRPCASVTLVGTAAAGAIVLLAGCRTLSTEDGTCNNNHNKNL